MNPTIGRAALSLATAALIMVAPLDPPVFAAPHETYTIEVGSYPYSMALSPNGKKAYVANYGDNTVSVINIKKGTVHRTPITVGDGPQSVAFTPNGKKAFVANYNDHTVPVINVKKDTVQGAPITVGNGPASVVFSPNGKKAYVVNANDYTVSVIKTR